MIGSTNARNQGRRPPGQSQSAKRLCRETRQHIAKQSVKGPHGLAFRQILALTHEVTSWLRDKVAVSGVASPPRGLALAQLCTTSAPGRSEANADSGTFAEVRQRAPCAGCSAVCGCALVPNVVQRCAGASCPG